MSFIDYQTFGVWVMFSIEKSIWIHYFYANDSLVRKCYLGHFFYELYDVDSREAK